MGHSVQRLPSLQHGSHKSTSLKSLVTQIIQHVPRSLEKNPRQISTLYKNVVWPSKNAGCPL
uniref:Uncharacterized protein n=1 Tax=Setaria italica TaxID=4555 RepID=K4AHT3_SETIT